MNRYVVDMLITMYGGGCSVNGTSNLMCERLPVAYVLTRQLKPCNSMIFKHGFLGAYLNPGNVFFRWRLSVVDTRAYFVKRSLTPLLASMRYLLARVSLADARSRAVRHRNVELVLLDLGFYQTLEPDTTRCTPSCGCSALIASATRGLGISNFTKRSDRSFRAEVTSRTKRVTWAAPKRVASRLCYA